MDVGFGGFHHSFQRCVAGCAWNVYVKNGIPMREEQVSKYPQLPGIPDMNPRGCQTVRVPARAMSNSDDWFTSDLILMWHINPIVTRIPDAHPAIHG